MERLRQLGLWMDVREMRQVKRLKKPLGEWRNRNQWEIIQQLSLSWLDLRNNLTHSKVASSS